MLILNLNLPDTKQKEWVYLDTQDGVIAISAVNKNGQLKLLLDAPKSVKIDRKSYIKKLQEQEGKK